MSALTSLYSSLLFARILSVMVSTCRCFFRGECRIVEEREDVVVLAVHPADGGIQSSSCWASMNFFCSSADQREH